MPLRDTEFLNVRVEGIRGSAALIGVDVNIDGRLPCKDTNDPCYSCCDAKGSYYRTCYAYTDGTMEHKRGLFINNQDMGCVHNWANLATRIDVEIYPKLEVSNSQWKPNPRAGRVRFDFSADEFTHAAHGGLYSPEVGLVSLPLEGFAPYLNGFICENGKRVSETRELDIKLWGKTPHPENSSKGYNIYGFAIIGAEGSYYNTGPMLSGKYQMVITDLKNNRCCKKVIDINNPGECIDLYLDKEDFGIDAEPC
ncbi:hypothetical protein DBB48_004755 [Bacillus altitudinis]|uniref:hypothetical protein n=1 Tax=Bacillus altitudinis TaxID=293387 RepID=UPI00224611ED|nr:hypothetical protein [Bacillus altitudinis]KAJ0073367.1 hypothetical protein DBB48_004755 [Bacillus altitudinis]